MKAPKLRAVSMVQRIRARQARQLAGKTDAEIIAFYRAAGTAATADLHDPPRCVVARAGELALDGRR